MRLAAAFLASALIFSIAVAGAPLRSPGVLSELEIDELFERWVAKHGKVYNGVSEHSLRRDIFAENLQKVNVHNQRFEEGLESYRMATNKFADLTPEEWRAQYLSGKISFAGNSTHGEPYVPQGQIPIGVDWRVMNVTHVRDQQLCGSCWAFSAVQAVESNVALSSKSPLMTLSVQEIVDCSKNGNQGCNGGDPRYAYDDLIDRFSGQIETQKLYGPYTSEDGKCNFNKAQDGATVTGFQLVTQGSEDDLVDAVSNSGPVSVCIEVEDSWMMYESGVYNSTNKCKSDMASLNHCVVLDGFMPEWFIVRNSWAEEWGEDGYIRMARGSNLCGIATEGTVPIAHTTQ